MKVFTTAAITLTILTAAGVGAAIAPAPKAQVVRWSPDTAPGALQILVGGGRIGVSVRDIDAEDVKRLKLPAATGVLVDDVQEDSPAQKAGLRDGDVVVEFDGERVRSTRQFTRLVQETPAGRQVATVVIRDGQRMNFSVEPESSAGRAIRELQRFQDYRVEPRPHSRVAPEPFVDVLPRIDRFFAGRSGRLGVTADTLSDQLAEYFGAKSGALVTSVAEGSAAAKAGLKAGDVITAIDGTAVKSASDLSRRTQRLDDGDEFTIEILRDRKPMTLKGKVERLQNRRWTTRTVI